MVQKLSYEEIFVGMEQHFTVEVTSRYQEVFREETGDYNPLHLDDTFAIAQGFPQKVIFGMLTASYLSTLAGVYLPGEKSLIHEVNTKFLKPVFVGDKLTVSGTVVEKNDTFRLLTIKAVIQNEKNQKVVKATMKVGVIG